jgi:hypothetical protein
MRAAALLPDNSEELADVIDMAGMWVKERDEKIADRYFLELKKRAPNTKIGRNVLPKRWFSYDPGPWSQEQETSYAAFIKELGIVPPE